MLGLRAADLAEYRLQRLRVATAIQAHAAARLRKIAGASAPALHAIMNIDVTLVRVIAIVLVLCPPSVGLIAYIVAWIVMPNDPLPMHAHPETVNSGA